MREEAERGKWGRSLSWTFLILASAVLVFQAVSLVFRVINSQTDFSVYYRTAKMMVEGGVPHLLLGKDAETGWYRCIPPPGLGLFAILTFLPMPGAAAVWSLINTILAGLGAWLLAKGAPHWQPGSPDPSLTRCAQAIWLLLASAGVQVGQMTVFFVVCWLASLVLFTERRKGLAGFILMAPALVKVYPALVLATFFKRGTARFWLGCLAAIAIIGAALPGVFARGAFVEMNSDFVKETLLSKSGRLATYMNPGGNNFSLDLVLVKAFGYKPPKDPPAGKERSISDLAPPWLIGLTLALKVLFLSLAAVRSLKLGTGTQPRVLWQQMALWCATLYLIMPENEARYAAYMVPALLPWLASVKGSRLPSLVHGLLILVALTSLLVPTPFSEEGFGLLGTALIWISQWLFVSPLPGANSADSQAASVEAPS